MKVLGLGEIISSAEPERVGKRSMPILSMTMRDGLVDQSDKFKKRVASEDISDYKAVKRGQLVVGFPIDEGVLAFQRLYDWGAVSPAYGVWNLVNPGEVFPDYLERFLRGPAALKFYASKLRSTTARRRSLPKDTFLGLPVPVPALAEQKRVAEILERADDLRHLRGRALERINSLGSAIFHHMFDDSLRNSKAFKKRPLGEIIRVASGSGLVAKDMHGGDVPVYGGNGINGWHDTETHPAGTIVIGRVGAHCGSVHVTERPAWITDNALAVTKKLQIETTYLAFAIRAANLNQYAGRAAQPLVSGSRIYPIEILLPPIEEQQAFGAQIRAQLELHSTFETAHGKIDRFITSVQCWAFMGDL
jgi:type I restriction enzyme S subunit